MQSLFIGLGAVLASAMPWMLTNWFHVAGGAAGHAIPATVRLSFYLGAVTFLTAVLWTVVSTREYPPEDMEAFHVMKAGKRGVRANVEEILDSIAGMPQTMRQLAPVQVLAWLGLFCMWLYFPVAVAHNVFGATDTSSPVYSAGVEWGGICFGLYSAICFVFAFFLPGIARAIGRKHTHSLCLLAGGIGLISVAFIHNQYVLLLTMVGVGIAWSSTLAMPYSVLAGSLPKEKTGVYMGIFNFFIVTPEIIASLFFGWVMNHLLHNNRLTAVVAGGCFMIVAALLMQRVYDPGEAKAEVEQKAALAPATAK